MSKCHTSLVGLAVVLLATACGGPAQLSSNDTPGVNPSITALPSEASISPRSTVVFAAAVQGLADTAVTWSIQEGSAGGTVDAFGSYSAPASPGTYHVVVASAAAPEIKSVATVNVAVNVAQPAGAITKVYVYDATLAPAATVRMKVSVTATGTIDQSVTWSLAAGSLGSINPVTGDYTAPSAPGTYTAWAISNVDSTKRDYGNITVSGGTPGPTLAVAPASTSVKVGQTVQYAATGTGLAGGAASWSVAEGSAGGTVSASGLYTAPSTPGTYHVVATSSTTSGVSATALVVVTSATASGAVFYVAHGGSDSAPGTLTSPWGTLRYAMRQLRPGDTLNVRGAPAGTDRTSACDGNNTGACWTETDSCAFGTCSPIHFDGNGIRAGTAENSRVTVQAYQDEVVIIEPASGEKVVSFNPSGGISACSYVTLTNLILDGRNVAAETVRVDPTTITANPDTGHCKYVNLIGGTIRHGKYTAGLFLVGSYWTIDGVEFTENGTQTSSGDHDHAIYLQGIRNKFIGGRVHHNMQGLQCWNEYINGYGYKGYNEFRGMEIDHNGVNPWGGLVRPGSGPDLGLYHDICSYSVVDSNLVHDNSSGSIGVSGDFGPVPANYSTITNNHIWNNGKDTIYIGDAVGITLSGNVYGAP